MTQGRFFLRYTNRMSPMFSPSTGRLGRSKRGEKTLAVVDIESGSVASALVRLSPHEAPKLFAENRVFLPVLHTRDSVALANAIEKAVEKTLLHTSGVAARMRNHNALISQGEIERVAIFFSPPWASMHLSLGTADYAEPIRKMAHMAVRGIFGEIPTTFHPLGTAAAHGALFLFPNEMPHLLCIVTGEVSEILLLSKRTVRGRATVPVGQRTLLRTLVSHGGVSVAEAESYLALATRGSHALNEPLGAAEDHFASVVTDAVRDLTGKDPLSEIIVMAHEPTPELFARALSRHEGLAGLFPQGGMVRTMRAGHAMPFIAAHAHVPDTCLMLEALFVDAKFGN